MAKEKIDFYRECQKLVEDEVYCDMTSYILYLQKQDDFWCGSNDCPVTADDMECKEWGNDDSDYDAHEWLCAYAVSDWLADELYDRGEIVARFRYTPCIWFRRTFGQAICIDGVIDQITRDLLVHSGRCTKAEAKKLSIC